jgi:hypothetical protein
MLTRREFVQSAGRATVAGLLGCVSGAKPGEPPDLAYATLRSRPHRRTENVKRGLQRLDWLPGAMDSCMYHHRTHPTLRRPFSCYFTAREATPSNGRRGL